MSVRANKRTYAIGLFLLTGWTPWGVELFAPRMPLVGNESGLKGGSRWVMCCGHVLRPKEMARWVDEGLVVPGEPDKFGRPTMVAGPKLARWLGVAFDGLQAKRWGQAR